MRGAFSRFRTHKMAMQGGKNLRGIWFEKLSGKKKEAAVGFNPAGEHNSAVTGVRTTTPFAISVEEMLQYVNLENQASSDEIAE